MTVNDYPYGLNMTRPPVHIFPGDRFDTPFGLLTVSIDGNTGDMTWTDDAGAVVVVSTLRYSAHYRADGRRVWPPGGAS